MKQEYIKDKDTVIAKIVRAGDWPENLHFYSNDTEFLQVATWDYNKGKHLKAHSHKVVPRSSDRTNEVLFVKSGEVEGIFYDEEDEIISKVIINAGDIVIIYAGGHAYNILSDETQVLEIKNGPYPGIEKDKRVIET